MMKGVLKYTGKNISSIQNHVLHGHGKNFTRFLSFLELQKNSHLDDASELSTDYGSRKRRKSDEVSVGGRFSDYLVPCHPYGDKHPKQKEFEVNIFALMAHAFTPLLLVDHYFLRNLKQDLDPRLCPVRQSKLSRSLIPTKKKLVEKSVIERLAEIKAVVISYDLWMSRKTEEIF